MSGFKLLELSVRTKNSLAANGVFNEDGLFNLSCSQLKQLEHLGKAGYAELCYELIKAINGRCGQESIDVMFNSHRKLKMIQDIVNK